MPRLTLRQRLERCKRQIARARQHHRKSSEAHKEAVDIMRRPIRREVAAERRGAR